MTRLDEPYALAHPSTVGLSPDGTNELLFVPTSIQRLLGAMTDQAPGPPNQACIHPDASEDDALSYPPKRVGLRRYRPRYSTFRQLHRQ